jgi:hypothetical protein
MRSWRDSVSCRFDGTRSHYTKGLGMGPAQSQTTTILMLSYSLCETRAQSNIKSADMNAQIVARGP